MAHGAPGLAEAYADALGIPNKREDLIYYLSCSHKIGQKATGAAPARAAGCSVIAIISTCLTCIDGCLRSWPDACCVGCLRPEKHWETADHDP